MSDAASTGKARPCPICKSESVAAYKPFCSKRCADVDLGKWFAASYAIPGTPDDDDRESAVKSGPEDEDVDR
ncbi:MAG TPA: DNA gyrase inhibitor YacG [Hyphomicrobium sp.]|nr:DNA gyrase inhibitor YacG [Hyphomicrobium sp.]